jgi:hypothetical protein
MRTFALASLFALVLLSGSVSAVDVQAWSIDPVANTFTLTTSSGKGQDPPRTKVRDYSALVCAGGETIGVDCWTTAVLEALRDEFQQEVFDFSLNLSTLDPLDPDGSIDPANECFHWWIQGGGVNANRIVSRDTVVREVLVSTAWDAGGDPIFVLSTCDPSSPPLSYPYKLP